jgi:formylglycine-generating enzyme required for sulfatase activity
VIGPANRNNKWTALSSSHLIHTTLICTAAVLAGALLFAVEADTAQAPGASSQGFTETIPGTLVKFEMVPVPGGSIEIDGATVNVEPFLIERTETTWDMYDVFALGLDSPRDTAGADATTRPSQPYGAPDYNWGHAGFPVMSVTRNAAEQFCKWLSTKTGKRYRLPTEAEWVRAAELAAGSTGTPASREPMTWHRGNSKGTTHAVGKRTPDALGLSDLFGNVAEWVMTKDDQMVTRGGSFRDRLEETGPAARAPYDASWQERDPQLPKSRWWLSDGPFVGFRVVTSPK